MKPMASMITSSGDGDKIPYLRATTTNSTLHQEVKQ